MIDHIEGIHDIRREIERAENAGDADAIAQLLADDVVVIVPDFPVMEGRETAAGFLRELLPGLLQHFDRRIAYTSVDVHLDGHSAIDRGEFAFTIQPRTGGALERVTGKYVWHFTRGDAGSWQCARMIVVRDETNEGEAAPREVEGVRSLVRFTIAGLVVYVPLETVYSLPALWSPFYLVDLIAMMLLTVGVWRYYRRRDPRAAVLWLIAGYAWSGANAWRALFDRVNAMNAGGSLRFGYAELSFVALGTVVSIVCLFWSLRIAFTSKK